MDGSSRRRPSEDRALVNSLYSIFDAYTEVTGNYVPPFENTSPKLNCPYSTVYAHSSRSLRIYPHTNSAWCFSCSERMTPLTLIMAFKEYTEEEAVAWIKAEVGYTEPDPEEAWDALMSQEDEFDPSSLADALKMACSRMAPDWKDRQFESDVSQKLGKCLSLLSLVKTEGDSKVWMAGSKRAMASVLGVASVD